MIRLRQAGGVHDGRVVEFSDAPVRMGRMPDSEVALDAHRDLDVSGRHAEVLTENGYWVVVDCGSRNGTYVNGERIGRQVLKSGDRIQLGEDGAVFHVEEALVEPQGEAPVDATGTSSPHAATQRTPAGAFGAGTPEAADAQAAAPHAAAQPAVPPEHARWAPTPFAPPSASTGPLTPAASPDPSPAPQHSGGWGVPQPAPNPPTPAATSAPAAPQTYGVPPSSAITPKPADGRSVGELTQAAMKTGGAPGALKAGVAILAVLFFVSLAVVLSAYLGRDATPDALAISTNNQEAVVQLVGSVGGQDAPFCTAFAVRASMLATSARCVLEIEARQRGGAFVQVVQGDQRYRVSRLWRHPDFDAATGASDVGLVEVDRALPLVVNLGDAGSGARHLVALGYGPRGLTATPLHADAGAGALTHTQILPAGAPLLDATGAVVGVHSVAQGWGDGVGDATSVTALHSLLAGLPE